MYQVLLPSLLFAVRTIWRYQSGNQKP